MAIYFLDFEASGLGDGSYPIEVAWVAEDGDTESHLIKPQPHWTDWDEVAEDIHGITREHLAADGVPAADVARMLAEALRGHTVYSDAPTQDQWWLGRLLATAGLDPVALEHVAEAYITACQPLTLRMPTMISAPVVQSCLRQADSEAQAAFPFAHRAAEDARRLWHTWRRLGEIVAHVIS
jgi:hypothetical protein